MHESDLAASRRLTVRFRASIPLLLALFVTLSAVALAQEQAGNDQRVISVVGQGIVYGQPDIATVELGVSATDPDAGAAVQEIDQRMREILVTLSGLGVPSQDIRTISYNIWREEQFPTDGQGTSQAVFRAQHMIAVELEGARRAGEVLAKAVDAGANAVGGIAFGFSDPAELEARARMAAVEDAHRRAAQLAASAGVGLGEPLAIEEITTQVPPGPYFERSAVAMSAAPISPGELSVEVRVAVTYRIE